MLANSRGNNPDTLRAYQPADFYPSLPRPPRVPMTEAQIIASMEQWAAAASRGGSSA